MQPPKPRPVVLYKFRPYSADPMSKERAWVRDTLFSHRVRFAKMSELNDPFEGRPYLVPQFDDPARQQQEIYKTALDDAHRAGLSGAKAIRDASLAVAAMNSPMTEGMTQRLMAEVIEESFWIYCLTATREPILLWSHYADGHKGMALHFRPLPFPVLFDVNYSEKYPEYRYPSADATAVDEATKAMLHTKAMQWKYEEEYRVIRSVSSPKIEQVYRDMGWAWEGQIATLPDSALVGVTLGAAMPKEAVRELTAELSDRRPLVEVWQAAAALKTYTLEFHRVQ
jgi:hypothetical protein